MNVVDAARGLEAAREHLARVEEHLRTVNTRLEALRARRTDAVQRVREARANLARLADGRAS